MTNKQRSHTTTIFTHNLDDKTVLSECFACYQSSLLINLDPPFQFKCNNCHIAGNCSQTVIDNLEHTLHYEIEKFSSIEEVMSSKIKVGMADLTNSCTFEVNDINAVKTLLDLTKANKLSLEMRLDQLRMQKALSLKLYSRASYKGKPHRILGVRYDPKDEMGTNIKVFLSGLAEPLRFYEIDDLEVKERPKTKYSKLDIESMNRDMMELRSKIKELNKKILSHRVRKAKSLTLAHTVSYKNKKYSIRSIRVKEANLAGLQIVLASINNSDHTIKLSLSDVDDLEVVVEKI